MLIASSLAIEATNLYESIQSGQLDVNQYLSSVGDMLPAWVKGLLDRFDLSNLNAVRERLSQLFSQFLQLVLSRAVTVGQSTHGFIVSLGVMLYLLFFLLRDGTSLTRRIKDAIPLRASQRDELLQKFAVVVRATVKGSILVAALQGALGGLIFWLLGIHAPVLWAVVMAFFALVPAVGASIVWLPVALYLLISGAVDAYLVAFGMLIISLQISCGRCSSAKATRMPDYLVGSQRSAAFRRWSQQLCHRPDGRRDVHRRLGHIHRRAEPPAGG